MPPGMQTDDRPTTPRGLRRVAGAASHFGGNHGTPETGAVMWPAMSPRRRLERARQAPADVTWPGGSGSETPTVCRKARVPPAARAQTPPPPPTDGGDDLRRRIAGRVNASAATVTRAWVDVTRLGGGGGGTQGLNREQFREGVKARFGVRLGDGQLDEIAGSQGRVTVADFVDICGTKPEPSVLGHRDGTGSPGPTGRRSFRGQQRQPPYALHRPDEAPSPRSRQGGPRPAEDGHWQTTSMRDFSPRPRQRQPAFVPAFTRRLREQDRRRCLSPGQRNRESAGNPITGSVAEWMAGISAHSK
eukprot:TRINITY_DN13635_c0_g1_i1.p2 TRINITY_DN13635_c0_g1~~TRINITY_DN13635_c0_g1_i1.p2  ORF type:complete len:303 (+),score=74.29 TRINITY_DN13635_c0_g1_i1:757-1665(+)